MKYINSNWHTKSQNFHTQKIMENFLNNSIVLASHLHNNIVYSSIYFFTLFLFQFQQNEISCWAMLLLLEVFMVTIIILFINMAYCLFRYTICGILRFRILLLLLKMAMRQQEKIHNKKSTKQLCGWLICWLN